MFYNLPVWVARRCGSDDCRWMGHKTTLIHWLLTLNHSRHCFHWLLHLHAWTMVLHVHQVLINMINTHKWYFISTASRRNWIHLLKKIGQNIHSSCHRTVWYVNDSGGKGVCVLLKNFVGFYKFGWNIFCVDRVPKFYIIVDLMFMNPSNHLPTVVQSRFIRSGMKCDSRMM